MRNSIILSNEIVVKLHCMRAHFTDLISVLKKKGIQYKVNRKGFIHVIYLRVCLNDISLLWADISNLTVNKQG